MGNAINFVSSYIGKSIITDFGVVCLEPYIRLLLGLSYNGVAALLFYFKLYRFVKNKLLFITFVFFHIYVQPVQLLFYSSFSNLVSELVD